MTGAHVTVKYILCLTVKRRLLLKVESFKLPYGLFLALFVVFE